MDDEEKAIAKNLPNLKKLFESNLRDLKVFKIGRVELDIYVVGLDTENILSGITDKSR